MEETISIENLTKVYKLYNKPIDRLKETLNPLKRSYHSKFSALENVNLVVNKGETIGIIGKNGAGKSTLLKIITGVLSPTNGNVRVNGEISALLELGTGFNPEYTGIENIYLNGVMRGITKEVMSKKIDEIVGFADIGEFINQPVKTYSSGMFARLAFAVMISFKPEILIVDEALSVGDVFFQQKCNVYMKNNMKDVTKILVTHDMASIAHMSDRVIVLSKGKIVFEGDPLKAIEYYTKSLHNEVFKSKNKIKLNENREKKNDLKGFKNIDVNSLSGAKEVIISSFKIQVNDLEYKGYIGKNDKLRISMLVESKIDVDNVIFGYIVNDKFGNAIFGENTCSSHLDIFYLEEDSKYLVSIEIIWPEIIEGDYFVTIGVGSGIHEMQHTIQCWAHNIIQVKNITFNSMHALFNNKINKIEIKNII